jgi:hypothetical protein
MFFDFRAGRKIGKSKPFGGFDRLIADGDDSEVHDFRRSWRGLAGWGQWLHAVEESDDCLRLVL